MVFSKEKFIKANELLLRYPSIEIAENFIDFKIRELNVKGEFEECLQLLEIRDVMYLLQGNIGIPAND